MEQDKTNMGADALAVLERARKLLLAMEEAVRCVLRENRKEAVDEALDAMPALRRSVGDALATAIQEVSDELRGSATRLHRVLVCGSREADSEGAKRVQQYLHRYHRDQPIGVLITGGAKGVDSFAQGWAIGQSVPYICHYAQWQLGKKAGPLRNREMLEMWQPDVVIAFPGGRGTRDMVRRAEAAGLPVRSVLWDHGNEQP